MTDSSEKPKSKRRWLRFGLRRFLIVVTFLGAGIGWYVYRAEKQQAAVEWILENGGSVVYDYQIDDSPPPSVPNWLLNMLGVDYFSSLIRVAVENAELSEVTPLAGLTKLERLRLSDTQVSDVTPLAGLTDLKFLMLSRTQVSDLSPLAGLTNLEVLYLYDTHVSDVTPLAGLTNLELLHISETHVCDVTLMTGLTNLEYLYLDHTQVSDKQIEKLRHALPNCRISHH